MQKISLNKQQKLLASWTGVGLAGVLLTVWVYLPLGLRLRKTGGELSKIHSELKAARETMASAKADREEPFRLPGQKEISSVIEEVTAFGKDLGIDFRSIRPQAVRDTPFGYQTLPIEMNLESPYRELGLFMRFLRESKRGMMTIESFEINREEGIFPELTCHLLVQMPLRP